MRMSAKSTESFFYITRKIAYCRAERVQQAVGYENKNTEQRVC
jgi:hypothetical protein